MRYIIYTLILTFSALANASEISEASSKEFIQSWAKSFNKNDPKAISAFYEKDKRVDMLVSVGLWLHGYDAILESYTTDMKLLKFSDSKIKNLRSRVFDKTALVSFEHFFKYRILSDNTLWSIHIRTTTTLKHTDEGWRIVMEHSSPIKGVNRATLIEQKKITRRTRRDS